MPPRTPPRGLQSPVGSALLRAYLDDLRGSTKADEVVLWLAVTGPTDLEPAAWSTTSGGAPELSSTGNRMALAHWAAQEGMVHTDGGDRVHFAVAPLSGSNEVMGVASVASADGFAMPKAELNTTLARHARHLAGLHELLITREQYSRSSQQTTALLSAAQRFTTQRTFAALSESIAQAVREMTTGRSVSIVRWDADTQQGTIVYAQGDSRAGKESFVAAESQVGAACIDDMPLIVEDARPLASYKPIYAQGESATELGSVAILPLHATTKNVIGAIVVEGARPRAVRSEDAKNLRLLALLAGASLETVWQIEEITRRATIDALTGLNNRGAFETVLHHVISETDRFGGASSLVLLDLDHFKKVNDTYGHLAGDAVLKSVADVIKKRVREVDSCARYGGEELALLLPRTEIEGATELAERLREAVAEREMPWETQKISVTVSCGVAAYPSCARTADALIAAADEALYAAKAAGRNCVRSARVVPARTTA